MCLVFLTLAIKHPKHFHFTALPQNEVTRRANWLRRSKSAPAPKQEEMAGTGSGMSSRGISFASGDGKPGWVRNQLQNIFQPTDNKLAMKLFGSKKALIQERVRQKAAGHWIIHPCSSFRRVAYLSNSLVKP